MDITQEDFEREMGRVRAEYEIRIIQLDRSRDRASKQLAEQSGKLENAELVAYTALAELELQGTLDFLLIKDPTLRTWWEENKTPTQENK